jgi:hypothetical protein
MSRRVRAVDVFAGAQRLALVGLVRCGVHRAVHGVVFLVRAGEKGLAVVVAQVEDQRSRAGCGAGVGRQVLAEAAGYRCSSVVK